MGHFVHDVCVYCQYESQRGSSQSLLFVYAFPCISLVHEVLHSAFTSTEGAVVYAGFLVRVLFKSTFVWRFGHASLCVVLVDATCVCIQLSYYGSLMLRLLPNQVRYQ